MVARNGEYRDTENLVRMKRFCFANTKYNGGSGS